MEAEQDMLVLANSTQSYFREALDAALRDSQVCVTESAQIYVVNMLNIGLYRFYVCALYVFNMFDMFVVLVCARCYMIYMRVYGFNMFHIGVYMLCMGVL